MRPPEGRTENPRDNMAEGYHETPTAGAMRDTYEAGRSLRRVLMLCYYFPPIGSAGTTRSVEFAKRLPRYGWHPIVLTVRNAKERWSSRQEPVPAGVEIHRTGELDLQGVVSVLHGASCRTARAVGIELERNYFHDVLCLPDAQVAWQTTITGTRLARHADAIYASCSPFSSAISACMIKTLTGRPLVLDFRDPWSLTLGTELNFSGRIQKWLERKVLKNADVVVVATGGIPTLPEIPGIDSPRVVKNADLHRMLKLFLRFIGPKMLRRLTRLWMPVGKRVVIIGGGIQGCELAEFLVKRNRKVTIVDSVDMLGEDMIRHLKQQLFWWFREKGVVMLAGVKPVAITDKGLVVLTKEGYKRTIEADSIVPAVSMKPDTELIEHLRGKVPEVYAVGDCGNPRLIVDAIADGWKIGNTI